MPQPIGIAHNRSCPEDLKVVVQLVVNITSDTPFVIRIKDGSDSVGMQGMIFQSYLPIPTHNLQDPFPVFPRQGRADTGDLQ